MTSSDPPDARSKALVRYQILSAYLALDPQRGQRRVLLEQLARKTWTGADGEPFRVSAETIRAWVRRYRRGGLTALADKAKPRRGVRVLSPALVKVVCDLKREVPERSLDRILRILEDMKLVEPGVVRRSTLHRVLAREGISGRDASPSERHDLDRFEADAPNDMWQSDMLAGPWLPDPDQPGKMRRAWLYAFLDDHSRLCLHGRFSFKGDLPALELVFRRAMQKYGVPRRIYYDNGATYRSHHMRQIVGEIGIQGITFTKTYRPMGHGKIEAFNRYTTSAFIAEVKASTIKTLDALNEAFVAWCDLEYNARVHGETGASPRDRWREGVARVQYVDDDKLRLAFLWKESRRADKAGIFSLLGTQYQVGAALAKRSLDVRYDPERLDLVEVWNEGVLAERVKPFEVHTHRRPHVTPVITAEPTTAPTRTDWLGHLTRKRRRDLPAEPTPHQLAETARATRAAQDHAIVNLIAGKLDPAVRNDAAVSEALDRHGPFDVDIVASILDAVIAREGRDQHVERYLAPIVAGRGGGA